MARLETKQWVGRLRIEGSWVSTIFGEDTWVLNEQRTFCSQCGVLYSYLERPLRKLEGPGYIMYREDRAMPPPAFLGRSGIVAFPEVWTVKVFVCSNKCERKWHQKLYRRRRQWLELQKAKQALKQVRSWLKNHDQHQPLSLSLKTVSEQPQISPN